ncbi:MAG: hypothetical protein ACJA1B_002767 [Polaribacter sp.]|jgi:hypothetical protein
MKDKKKSIKNNFLISKQIVLFIILLISATNIFSQKSIDSLQKKTFIKKLWGEKLEDGFIFMPLGSHTVRPDVFDVWYTGVSYKNIELSVFRNSFRDWTLGIYYKRVWYFSEKFYATFAGGMFYGYKGKLQTVKEIPFRDSFIVTGDINPALGLDVDYRISKKISIHGSVTPLIIIYGFKYYF